MIKPTQTPQNAPLGTPQNAPLGTPQNAPLGTQVAILVNLLSAGVGSVLNLVVKKS
jgi:hypothetical protein